MDIFLVALGGAIGAIARYSLSLQFSKWFGTGFPSGTFFINLTGSFLLGLFLGLVSRGFFSDESYRWLVAVGFCSGYTTFSTYTFETLSLLRAKLYWRAIAGYLLGSTVFGFLAAVLGFGIGGGF
jgi:fluoride exporter